MKNKFWTSEKTIGLTALLVSLSTLIVFVYQTNLIRQQQYMSVYPYLNLTNMYSGTLRYNYTLSNEGIGPAFIESVKVSTSNSKIYEDVIDYVDDNINKDSIWYFHTNLSVGNIIPANGKVPLIQLVNREMLKNLELDELENMPNNTLDDSFKLYQILNDTNAKIEIIYSSVYGEKWSIGNHSKIPKKIK